MGIKTFRGHHFFDNNINENSIIFDLGAHKGDFSRQLFNKYSPHIYIFEANPHLIESISIDNNKIQIIDSAISDKTGKTNFYLADNIEGSSILKNHRDARTSVIQVDAIIFDEFVEDNGIEKIDLLKVDIEGAEINVFNKMKDTTLKKVSQITIEFHDFIEKLNVVEDVENIKVRLQKLGYKMILFERPNKDVLFVNIKKAKVPYLYYYLIVLYARVFIAYNIIMPRLKNRVKKIIRK